MCRMPILPMLALTVAIALPMTARAQEDDGGWILETFTAAERAAFTPGQRAVLKDVAVLYVPVAELAYTAGSCSRHLTEDEKRGVWQDFYGKVFIGDPEGDRFKTNWNGTIAKMLSESYAQGERDFETTPLNRSACRRLVDEGVTAVNATAERLQRRDAATRK